MKTPKEKAAELIVRFMPYSLSYKDNHAAKLCALIAVDEIISVLPSVNGRPPNYQDINKYVTEYWQEVKTEINNL